MEYDEIFGQAVTRLVEKALFDQSCEGRRINLQVKDLAQLEYKLREYASGLGAEAEKVLEDYLTLRAEIDQKKFEYVYVQSAKDCAMILKGLGICDRPCQE